MPRLSDKAQLVSLVVGVSVGRNFGEQRVTAVRVPRIHREQRVTVLSESSEDLQGEASNGTVRVLRIYREQRVTLHCSEDI